MINSSVLTAEHAGDPVAELGAKSGAGKHRDNGAGPASGRKSISEF